MVACRINVPPGGAEWHYRNQGQRVPLRIADGGVSTALGPWASHRPICSSKDEEGEDSEEEEDEEHGAKQRRTLERPCGRGPPLTGPGRESPLLTVEGGGGINRALSGEAQSLHSDGWSDRRSPRRAAQSPPRIIRSAAAGGFPRRRSSRTWESPGGDHPPREPLVHVF